MVQKLLPSLPKVPPKLQNARLCNSRVIGVSKKRMHSLQRSESMGKIGKPFRWLWARGMLLRSFLCCRYFDVDGELMLCALDLPCTCCQARSFYQSFRDKSLLEVAAPSGRGSTEASGSTTVSQSAADVSEASVSVVSMETKSETVDAQAAVPDSAAVSVAISSASGSDATHSAPEGDVHW